MALASKTTNCTLPWVWSTATKRRGKTFLKTRALKFVFDGGIFVLYFLQLNDKLMYPWGRSSNVTPFAKLTLRLLIAPLA